MDEFVDGPPRIGQFTYPFVLQIPDWVPASMKLHASHEDAKFSINYELRAQFIPVDKKDWADAKKGISLFRGATAIHINRPTVQVPVKNISTSLDRKVGGFLGIRATPTKMEFIFEKNEYYLGEIAKVRVICDNSECRKPV